MLSDIGNAVVATTIFATVLSLYALLLLIVHGEEPFRANSTAFPVVVATYHVAACLVGLAVGLLLPLTATRRGKMFVGSIVLACIYGSVFFAVDGFEIDAADGAFIAILSLVGGSFFGSRLHSAFTRK